MEINIEPIGKLVSNEKYKYEQPRQSHYAQNRGKIVLNSGFNFEQALEDLEQFDKIWVIYLFDRNSHWKPKVSPPISIGRKIGLFATRSPYRPNPIGISCIDLISIKGRTLEVANFDLLDSTPIIDIKPYIAEHDSFPNASRGWLPQIPLSKINIEWSDSATSKANFILNNGKFDLFNAVAVQLSVEPTNRKKKRVSEIDSSHYILSIRTWRILFEYTNNSLKIENIESGYTSEELKSSINKYGDKRVHINFIDFTAQKREKNDI
jgi:tRNA-Thr(GGU) m(6)t(6)A37 methyltransferase TsaA